MAADAASFFTEYGEATRYTILEVIGKGSYGVVCSAIDNTNGAAPRPPRHPIAHSDCTVPGERVAIKKINDVFEHVSASARRPRVLTRRAWLTRHLHTGCDQNTARDQAAAPAEAPGYCGDQAHHAAAAAA
jgi:serine/threonine protein kinase